MTGLEFSPKDNALSWACVDGTFNTWTEPVPADKPHPAEQPRVHATRQQGLGDEGDSALPLDDDEDFGEDLADFDNDDWIIDDEGPGGGKYKERETTPGLGNGVREVGMSRSSREPYLNRSYPGLLGQSELQKLKQRFSRVPPPCGIKSAI